MSHGKSLRVIGQTLEAARILNFELDKRGPQYIVCIASKKNLSEGFLRNGSKNNDPNDHGVFCFSPADISRLDAQAQKRRRNQSSSTARLSRRLSHQLRALGDHLDRIEVSGFHIVWSANFIIVDYQMVDGRRKRRIFTPEELRQLVLHRSLLRSGYYLFPQLEI